MNDLIQRITNAIFRQEGMPADYPNPGNLRQAPWSTRAIVNGGFWKPTSRAEGVSGAAHVVALAIARGKSLEQLISQWAPPNENKTATYIKNVKEWAAIPDEKAPLWEYLAA